MQHDPGGKKKSPWPVGSTVSARFSVCERYRYELSEIWGDKQCLVMFLLMNPSVAAVEFADPTLIKTGKYARAWGYGDQRPILGKAQVREAIVKQKACRG